MIGKWHEEVIEGANTFVMTDIKNTDNITSAMSSKA